MANLESIQTLAFPLPPSQYITAFTDENVRKNKIPKPPPIPTTEYKMFGKPFSNDENIITPLESQGFKRLYPQHFDRKKELKKMNHSILINFLDLIELLVKYPDSPRRAEKIDDLTQLFVHIHHLLNEFRPHQARETLRVMMELQKRQRLETAQRFQKHLEKVRDIVKSAFATLPDQMESNSKLLIPVEMMETDRETEQTTDSCCQMDRIMCDIVDEFSN
ncbi:mediator of RNA polymerase II transcription subunit 7 [Culicoides brevitarsis]|uniref:mediator of RNA polymerase II transcription subunit 7 n=1 Tax=Culicoides brevitarsis TaxID=469753 RepID=UPI00307BCC3A